MAQPRKTSKRTSKNSEASPSSKASIESKPVKRPTGKAGDAGLSGDHPTVAMVRGLAAIVESHGLSELIVEMPDATLTLRRAVAAAPVAIPPPVAAGPAMAPGAAPPPVAPAAAAPPPPRLAAPEPATPADDYHVVTSPFVGTFYCRPNPDADPYVVAGGRVEKGQVLCIIEAMKLMNEIEADISGTIVAVLAADAEPVEFGQPLFKIARS